MLHRTVARFVARWEFAVFAMLVGLILSGCGGGNGAVASSTRSYSGAVSNGTQEIGRLEFEISAEGNATGRLLVLSTGRAEPANYVPPVGAYSVAGTAGQASVFTMIGTLPDSGKIEVNVTLPQGNDVGSFRLRAGKFMAGGGAVGNSGGNNGGSDASQEWAGGGSLGGQGGGNGGQQSPPPPGDKTEPTGVCSELPMDREGLCMETYAYEDADIDREVFTDTATEMHWWNITPKSPNDYVYYATFSFVQPAQTNALRRELWLFSDTHFPLEVGMRYWLDGSYGRPHLRYLEGEDGDTQSRWFAIRGNFVIDAVNSDFVRVRFTDVKFRGASEKGFSAEGVAVFSTANPPKFPTDP